VAFPSPTLNNTVTQSQLSHRRSQYVFCCIIQSTQEQEDSASNDSDEDILSTIGEISHRLIGPTFEAGGDFGPLVHNLPGGYEDRAEDSSVQLREMLASIHDLEDDLINVGCYTCTTWIHMLLRREVKDKVTMRNMHLVSINTLVIFSEV